MEIIVEQIPAYAVVAEYLLCIFNREPLCTFNLAGENKVGFFDLAGKTKHKVALCRVRVGLDKFKRGYVKSDFLLDFSYDGIFGRFAVFNVSCNVYEIVGNVALSDKCDFRAVLGDAKAYHAGVGKGEKGSFAASAVGYFTLVTANLGK